MSSHESDTDDDEYTPGKDAATCEQLSEESEDEIVEDEIENVPNKRKGPKSLLKNIKRQKKELKHEYSSDSDESNVQRIPFNEEDEKKKSDALWASFLSENDTKTENSVSAIVTPERKKMTVTESFEYAGEEVKITKEIEIPAKEKPSTSLTKKESSSSPTVSKLLTIPLKTLKRTSGIGTLLGQLGKNKKISTLEKTKLDWTSFKKGEGIEEEIETHNKGKDGYLERQDFLERTDFKQFDIEKNIRQSKREKR